MKLCAHSLEGMVCSSPRLDADRHLFLLCSMRVPMLSSYPADKIVASCDRCGLRKRFDKAAMLKTGGDRPLGLLLDDISGDPGQLPKAQGDSGYLRPLRDHLS